MKLPAFLPPPRRAERTRLPAALTALLVLLLAVQLLLPTAVELPEAGVVRPLHLAPLVVAPIAINPAIALRPLFAPGRRESYAAGVADKAAPLEGARAVGLITSRRGGARVFVQAADGRVAGIAPGGLYRGWQLVRIEPPEVQFRRGSETATLTITASAPPAAAPSADATPEEEEAQ